jgi:hypothetical protein
MKNTLVILVFVVILSNLSFGQTKNNKLNSFVGKGIEYVQKDSLFSMAVQFRIQNRVAYFSTSLTDFTPDVFEFRVRRMRLKFKGFMLTPKLTYYFQLGFSKGDLDWESGSSNVINSTPNIIRDAIVYYEIVKGLKLGLGQTKLPGNRQRLISSGDQQFYDLSIVNATFNLDRDFGLFATYDNKKLPFRIKGEITSGEGRNSLKSDKGLNYTTRLEFLPFGRFTRENEDCEGDLEREMKPKLALGISYNYNTHAMRQGGTLGRELYEKVNMQNLHADLLFKYKGFAVLHETCLRNVDKPVTVNANGDIRSVYNGFGCNTQLSYNFKNNFEIAARYSFVSPNKNVYDNHDFLTVNEQRYEQWQAGVSKYFIGHRVKVQADLLYHISKDLKNATQKGILGAVFQVELGF